jgi:hypothetical protein
VEESVFWNGDVLGIPRSARNDNEFVGQGFRKNWVMSAETGGLGNPLYSSLRESSASAAGETLSSIKSVISTAELTHHMQTARITQISKYVR